MLFDESGQNASDSSSDELDETHIFEDLEYGDFTKRLNSIRLNGTGPNSQVTLGSLNLSKKGLRSGENQIQLHLDSNGDRKGKRNKDRADRATVEQVLDPRTRLILFRLVQRGFLECIEGCVSTGKEANVYHALDKEGVSVAIKIYKTSILTFKDRDRYVTGEFRYRNGYSRHNPRKMVATWAEKEMRNLQRMHQAGLPVPRSHLLKSHVLVMDFVGTNGWPAPLLKHAEIGRELASKLYVDCVRYVKILYNKCKLVHADLSEYNILFHDDSLVIIDVSQSVEHDHPHSLQFLRSDITNITRFFHGKGAPVLTPHRLFELIVDPLLESDQAMEKVLSEERLDIIEDSQYLFLNVFIPHKLDNIVNFERDHEMEKDGTELNNPFQKIIAKTVGIKEESESSETQSKSECETDTDDDDEKKEKVDFAHKHQKYVRVRGETTEDKKVRKQAVQEEKRTKRADLDVEMQPMTLTTSLYTSVKDRQAEVAQRRKDREVRLAKEREERIRVVNERAKRALERKEQCLQEKVNKNKHQEEEKLKEIKRKRVEKEQLESEKKKIFEQKANSSRTPLFRQSKHAIAFGSGVPRKLDFGSPSLKSALILNSKVLDRKPALNLMTSSVHSPSLKVTSKLEPNKSGMFMTRSLYCQPKMSEKPFTRAVTTNKRVVVRRKSLNAGLSKSEGVTKTDQNNSSNDSGAGTSANESTESIIFPPNLKSVDVKHVDSDNESNGTVSLAMPSVNLEKLKDVCLNPPSVPHEEVNASDSDVTPLVSSRDESARNTVNEWLQYGGEQAAGSSLVYKNEEESFPPQLQGDQVEESMKVKFLKRKEYAKDDVLVEIQEVNVTPVKEEKKIFDVKELEHGVVEQSKVVEKSEDNIVFHIHGPETEEDQSALDSNKNLSIQINRDVENTLFEILGNIEGIKEVAEDDHRPLNDFISRFTNKSAPNIQNEEEAHLFNETPVPEAPIHSTSTPTLRKLKGGAILGLTEKLEQERINRRQKLAEIMSKNRDSSLQTSPVIQALSSVPRPMEGMERIRELFDRRSKSNTPAQNSERNTPMNQGPAAKLSLSMELQATSLADELANLQLSSPASRILPEQIPET